VAWSELNADVPHSARIYDHLLGGKDNFAADRDAAAAITADWPHLAVSMRADRAGHGAGQPLAPRCRCPSRS
jgi:S-adenosyl methyltransferase